MLAHKITTDMNQRWASKLFSFTWNYVSDSGHQSSWCLQFKDAEAYDAFLQAFTKANWEALNQYPWEKAKVCIACPFSYSSSH